MVSMLVMTSGEMAVGTGVVGKLVAVGGRGIAVGERTVEVGGGNVGVGGDCGAQAAITSRIPPRVRRTVFCCMTKPLFLCDGV